MSESHQSHRGNPTTVGYGDLSPSTGLARVLAVVLMLVGIGTIGLLTASIATYFLGGASKAADPEVEHVRARLAEWDTLIAAERRRRVEVLGVLASEHKRQ
jgi:voltage-gated potassium channel